MNGIEVASILIKYSKIIRKNRKGIPKIQLVKMPIKCDTEFEKMVLKENTKYLIKKMNTEVIPL